MIHASATVTKDPAGPQSLVPAASARRARSPMSDNGAGGIVPVGNIADFEDIGLADDDAMIDHRRRPGGLLPIRESKREAPATTATSTPSNSTRDLTGSKPASGSGNGHSNKAAPIPHLDLRSGGLDPRGPLMVQTGAQRAQGRPSRRRSPNPLELSRQRQRSVSPAVVPGSPAAPIGATCPLPQTQPASRPAPLPRRKSAQELEDEYDDSDEDLPPDATLWNVPISPRPIEERRLGPLGGGLSSPRPLPLSHSVSSLPISKNPSPERSPPPAPPPVANNKARSSRTLRASSAGPPAYDRRARSPRFNSWHAVMSELSEEARVLTETLEMHADNEARKEPKARPASDAARSSNIIQLPPLQRPNVMMDPLPVSKEKERVLSRTRPSWLPPKDPEEERRHLKQYKQMMAQSRDKGELLSYLVWIVMMAD